MDWNAYLEDGAPEIWRTEGREGELYSLGVQHNLDIEPDAARNLSKAAVRQHDLHPLGVLYEFTVVTKDHTPVQGPGVDLCDQFLFPTVQCRPVAQKSNTNRFRSRLRANTVQ